MESIDLDEAKLYALIGARLRQLRIDNEKSQAWVAERIGMLRTSITNVETGRQKAPLHVIYAMCALFEADPRDILPSLSEIAIRNQAAQEFDAERLAPGAPKAADFLRQIMDASAEDDA